MRTKTQLYRLSDGTVAYLEMNSVEKILKDKGLDTAGDVQQFHTANVLRRIQRYMPYGSGPNPGMTIKVTIAQTVISRPEIVTDTPYAKYLFYGKVMVDPKTGAAGFMTPVGWRSRKGCVKVRTNRNLEFFKGKNPKAGPMWDRSLSAAEGAAMRADLQRYIDRR